MQTRCFDIDASGRFEETDIEAALRRWKAGEGPFWIDATNAGPDDHERLLRRVGLAPETVGMIMQQGHAARVLPLDTVVFFEFPTQVAEEPPQIVSVDVVCVDRLVVTLNELPLPLGNWTGDDFISMLSVKERSTSAIVCALLVALSIRIRGRSMELRKKVVELGRVMDVDPEEVSIADLIDLKHRIMDLDAILDERSAVLENIGEMRKPFLDLTEFAAQVSLATGNTESTARRVDRLASRVTDLQLRYDLMQQEKTNRRLGRLTVISAIFLPLTLVAGIYGMNFDMMPELHYSYGYFTVLGLMAVIGVGLFWWFRSHGWME